MSAVRWERVLLRLAKPHQFHLSTGNTLEESKHLLSALLQPTTQTTHTQPRGCWLAHVNSFKSRWLSPGCLQYLAAGKSDTISMLLILEDANGFIYDVRLTTMWFDSNGCFIKRCHSFSLIYLTPCVLLCRLGRNAGSYSAAAAWVATPTFWSITRMIIPRNPSESSTCTAASRWTPAWPSSERSSRAALCSTSRPQTAPSISLPRPRTRWTSGCAPSASCAALTSQTITTVGNASPTLGVLLSFFFSPDQCFVIYPGVSYHFPHAKLTIV